MTRQIGPHGSIRVLTGPPHPWTGDDGPQPRLKNRWRQRGVDAACRKMCGSCGLPARIPIGTPRLLFVARRRPFSGRRNQHGSRGLRTSTRSRFSAQNVEVDILSLSRSEESTISCVEVAEVVFRSCDGEIDDATREDS